MGSRGQRVVVVGIIVIAVVVALVLLVRPTHNPSPPTPGRGPVPTAVRTAVAHRIGQRTKTSGCVVRGPLPDSACTPGALLTTDANTVCRSGYASSVRNVPQSEKEAAYAEYGITSRRTGQYEVDHLISLQLGGSNDLSNLWPEATSPKPGSYEKDRVETYLHTQVCDGTISLGQAQEEIAADWLSIYDRMP